MAQDPYFFGYGSLVNVMTHSYANPAKAALKGWRRAWRHTRHRDISFLTAVPDQDAEILGLIAPVPNADWAALDAREFAYDRCDAQGMVTHSLPNRIDIAVYAIPESDQAIPTSDNPILLSYLDVVIQGYLHQFGQDGVKHFEETTLGWDAPILNDRTSPLYPRAQILSAQETKTVDNLIENVGATLIAVPA